MDAFGALGANTPEHPGIPPYTQEHPGIPLNIREHPVIRLYIQEPRYTLNIQEPPGMPRNALSRPGAILGRSGSSWNIPVCSETPLSDLQNEMTR